MSARTKTYATSNPLPMPILALVPKVEAKPIANRVKIVAYFLDWFDYYYDLNMSSEAMECLDWACWFQSAPIPKFNIQVIKWRVYMIKKEQI